MARSSPPSPLHAHANTVIGKRTCKACNSVNLVKVNKRGWPYCICAHCTEERSQSVASARRVIGSITTWVKGKKAVILADLEKPVSEIEEMDALPGLEFETEAEAQSEKRQPESDEKPEEKWSLEKFFS